MADDDKNDNPEGVKIGYAEYEISSDGAVRWIGPGKSKPIKPVDFEGDTLDDIAGMDTEPVEKVSEEDIDAAWGKDTADDESESYEPDIAVKSGSQVRVKTDPMFMILDTIPGYQGKHAAAIDAIYHGMVKGDCTEEDLRWFGEQNDIEGLTLQVARSISEKYQEDHAPKPESLEVVPELAEPEEKDYARTDTSPGMGGPDDEVLNSIEDMMPYFDEPKKE